MTTFFLKITDEKIGSWMVNTGVYVFSSLRSISSGDLIKITSNPSYKGKNEPFVLKSTTPYTATCSLGSFQSRAYRIDWVSPCVGFFYVSYTRQDDFRKESHANVICFEYNPSFFPLSIYVPFCDGRHLCFKPSYGVKTDEQIRQAILRYASSANFFNLEGKFLATPWVKVHPAIQQRIRSLPQFQDCEIFTSARYYHHSTENFICKPLETEDVRFKNPLMEIRKRVQ